MARPHRLATAARSVAWGQSVFVGGLLACVALAPHLVLKASEVGVSNFGVHATTVVPYGVAFVGSVVGLARASRHVRRPYGEAFAACAVCYGAALVTTYPYHLDTGLKDLHDATGIATMVVSFGLGVVALARERRLAPVLAAHLAGLAVGTVTLVGAWHLLFAAQVSTSVAFSVEATVLAQRVALARST
ncbi:MAG TPA: hypothetical protein PLS29_02845 [Acidimicrobiales bacterium]|nr:MAG: hypothetical protein B7Z69_01145 [Actinobacteria bacterium 21-73-9]HQU25950.1 hypothetical protein [Acidimicrobiales bacterium]